MTNFKRFLTLSLIAALAVQVWAVPAYRGWQTKTQPDGTTITIRQTGDEFFHYWENEEGQQVKLNEDGWWRVLDTPTVQSEISKQKQASRKYNQRGGDSMIRKAAGTINLAPRGLVILVNYSDVTFRSENTQAAMSDLMNSENYTYNSATGSVREFFKAQSNGAYVPDFDVVGPYNLTNTRAHYGSNDSGGDDLLAGDMIVEACKAADADGVDFTLYNNDGDSYVDFVYVIYAGEGEADSDEDDAIWPHNWTLSSARYYNNCSYSASQSKVDGLYIENYACSGELRGRSTTRCPIGTIAHEFGHVLGLPDYYVTSKSAANYPYDYTPGAWHIMDYGSYNNDGRTPPNYSPHDKLYFGWYTINTSSSKFLAKDAKANGTLTTTYGSWYQITGTTSSATAKSTSRVWYLENRQKSGWDRYLPGHGMVVWEVTYNSSNWTGNTPNNTSVGYTVVTANSLTRPYEPYVDETTASSTSGTPFPGTSNVTSYTPATGCALTNITESAGNITFKYNGGVVKTRATYEFLTDHCTAPADGDVAINDPLSVTITPNSGYTLDDASCWDVEMGGVPLVYGTDFTYNASTNTFYVASLTDDIVILAEAKVVHTVTWSVQGITSTTTFADGAALVLPADPSDCAGTGGKKFVGWTESSTVTGSAPADLFTAAGTKTVTANTTYYAVYATASGSGGSGSTVTLNANTDTSFPKDGITLTTSNGVLNNGTDYRIYKGATLTITSSVGNISSIAFTFDGTYDGGGWETSYTPNASSWTSPACTSGSGGKQARITQIVVTIGSGGGGSSYSDYSLLCTTCSNTPTMSFTPATVNKTTSDATFTKVVSMSGNGPGQIAQYNSSDESVATVTNSGVVTLKGKVGSTTITAAVLASGDYCPASASYTLNVTAAPIDVTLYYNGTSANLTNQTNPYTLPTEAPYNTAMCSGDWTFAGWYGSSYAKSTDAPTYITQLTSTGSAYAVYTTTETSSGGSGSTVTLNANTDTSFPKDGITLTTSNGVLNNGTDYRIYKGATLTITSSVGNISSIAFTFDGTYDGGGWETSYTPNASSWTSPACTSGSGGKQARITQIVVTIGSGGGSSTTYYATTPECVTPCSNTPTMSFTNETVNKTTADATYTQVVTISGKGPGQTVLYSSSDETVATVDNSGVVTLKGKVGSTTITASVAADGDYCAASASYTLNVTAAPIDVTLYYNGTSANLTNQTNPYTLPTDAPYNTAMCSGDWTFAGWYGSSYAKSTDAPTYITQLTSTGSAYAVYTTTETSGGGGGSTVTLNATTDTSFPKDGITLTTSNGVLNNGTDYRIYKGATLTITSSVGNISSIAFTFDGTYDGGGWETSYTPNASSWTSPACTSGSGGKQARITQIVITVGGGGSSTTYYATTPECVTPCSNTPTMSFTNETVNKTTADATYTQTVTITGKGAGQTVLYSSSDETVATVDNSGVVTLKSKVGSTTITASVAADGDYCAASASYTLNVTAASYTVTWSSNGDDSHTATYHEGEDIVFPSSADGCDDMTFMGWVSAAIPTPQDEEPSYVTSGTMPNHDVTYYAVFADEDEGGSGGSTYTLVEESLTDWSGNYIIVNADDDKAMKNTVSGGEFGSKDVTPSSKKITTTDNTIIWIFEKGTGDNASKYSVKSKDSGKYAGIGSTSTSGSLGDAASYFTITHYGTSHQNDVAASSGRFFSYYGSNATFRTYAGTSAGVLLYRSNSSYSGYTTSCTSCLTKVTLTKGEETNGAFTLNKADGAYNNCTSNFVVTVSNITPADHYHCTGVTATGGNSEVSGPDGSGNYTVTYTKGNNITSTITANFAPNPTNAIRFFNNGVQVGETQNLYEGQVATKPSPDPTACTGYTFVGWWTEALATDNTTAETWVTDFTVSGAQDYYAVYSLSDGEGGEPSTINFAKADFSGSGTISASKSGVTVSCVGNIPSGGYVTFTEGNTLTITSSSGNITAIDFTCSSDDYTGNMTDVSGISSSSWSITVDNPGAKTTVRVSGIAVTVDGSGTTYYTTAPDCCSEVVAPTVNVTAKSTSAIISWNNQANAVNGYSVTVKEGNSVVYENNFAAGVTSCNVTGLSSSTEYNYTVVAKGETCNSSASGNFTTTACEDAPVLGIVTVTATTATLDWTCSAASATIKLYSDEECTDQVGSDYASVTSPYTIEHLTSETTYYFKVFSGGTCSSNVGSFTTEKLDLDVAEWQEDAVVISYNGDGELTLTTYTEETHGDPHANVADDIFFSKYYEAARNVKLLAVFNGTLADVNLSDYKLGLAQSSGADKAFTFTKFSDFKKGDGEKLTADELKLKPNEELILISYKDDDSMDQQIISCAQADESTSKFSSYVRLSTPELQFNGDDAIALLDADGKMIDLIGAGTKDGGSVHAGASFQTCSSSAGTFNGFMDTPGGWYTPNGYQANQDNTETFPYGLSSNRCLLIRRKHVKSGYNAVLHNKEDFLTLGNYEYEDTDYEGEWKGVQIPGSTSSGEGLTNSCTGFDDVGSYNYNEYYIEFEQDLVEQTFENYKSDPFDGTYVIPVTGLSDLACSNIRIELKDGEGNLILGKNIKVPIMVTGSMSTTDDIFHSNYKDADICRSCDLVIFDNAQLTKVTDGTANDVDAVRDVKVYPGGKLIVPGGTNYSVNSISFRREEDDVATADIRGNLNIRETGDYVFLDMRVDPTNWHYFSLPYDCNVNDITLSTGEPATLGTDYLIKWYDGGKRAATQSGGCWETVAADATLKKGIGYIFSIPGTGIVKREFRFPMSNNVMSEEKEAQKVAYGVFSYGGDQDMNTVRANHRGWNLLGDPYLLPYTSDIEDPVMTGYIVPDYPSDPEEIWDGHYKFDEDPTTHTYLRYIVEPIDNGWSGYRQVAIASYEMKPFTSYFVQIGGDHPDDPQGVQFNLSAVNRSASPVRRAPAEYEEVEDRHPVWCAVTLTNPKGEKDETTLLISDNFTDGYDMMDDLTKWRGTYYQYAQITTKPVLASRNNEGEMAFNALPDSSALAGVPLNYFAASQGFYTFAYDDKYDRDMEVKEVKLWDKTTNQWYDLMNEPYSFSTARTDNKDRFVLSVRVERKHNQTTTDRENAGTYRGDKPRKLLINGLLYIQRGKDVYDVTGKQLLNR